MDTLPSSPITAPATAGTAVQVVISQLCRSPDYQVRQKLCWDTVKRYAGNTKAGQVLPPVQVALVDGVACLVDGYHRVAALELLGHLTAEAVVVEATRENARWMAAQANMNHGLPLKPREFRKVFQVYVQTGRHKKGQGKLKHYREIGLELGRPHTTIRNWMAKDFPKVFHQLAKQYGEGNAPEGGCHPLPPPPPAQATRALEHLENARQAYQEATCPQARETIRQAFEESARDVLGSDWRDTSRDF